MRHDDIMSQVSIMSNIFLGFVPPRYHCGLLYLYRDWTCVKQYYNYWWIPLLLDIIDGGVVPITPVIYTSNNFFLKGKFVSRSNLSIHCHQSMHILWPNWPITCGTVSKPLHFQTLRISARQYFLGI